MSYEPRDQDDDLLDLLHCMPHYYPADDKLETKLRLISNAPGRGPRTRPGWRTPGGTAESGTSLRQPPRTDASFWRAMASGFFTSAYSSVSVSM